MNSQTSQLTDPKVTIIVPARNEESNIDRCLRSLVVQRGVAFEIIVVDDASTDRTREIAETFTRVQDCPFIATNSDLRGVRVISARAPLPELWTGKANACHTGALAARGEWMLFTDADTQHEPIALATAYAEANTHHVDLLSYSPEQHLEGFLQKALMPVVFAELASVYEPAKVSDPLSPVAAANGQYLLISRQAFNMSGGFEAVSASLLEDVAIARNVKRLGGRLRFRLGRGLVRTFMYKDWPSMRAGWTKNLALLFPHAKRRAFMRNCEFSLLIGLPIHAALILAFMRYARTAAGIELAMAAVLWALFLFRIRRAHFDATSTALAVFGLPLFARLLRRSVAAHKAKNVEWKGRKYSGNVTIDTDGHSNQEKTPTVAGS